MLNHSKSSYTSKVKEDVLYPSIKLILVYIVYAVLIACCIFTRVSQHTKVVQIITIMTYGCATVHMSRATKKNQELRGFHCEVSSILRNGRFYKGIYQKCLF